MNVLYINHSSEIEGSGIAMINTILGLKTKGVSPIVVLPKDGPLLIRLAEYGIAYRVIPFFTSNYCEEKFSCVAYFRRFIVWILHIFVNTIAILKLCIIIKGEKIQIVHTNTGIVHIGFYASLIIHTRHVWHLREYQDLDFGMKPYMGFRVFRLLLSYKQNYCIAITKGIFAHFELNKGKDSVIYDGVASQNYKSKYQSDKKNYLLYVGTLSEGKGIIDLLTAYKSVSSIVDSELWLAGRDVIGIAKLVKEYDLSERVKYLGVRNDVYELMNNSKALIVPSRFEGFGFITAEAMLNYCLVIGRNTAGTKEQFDNGLLWSQREIAWRFETQKELESLLVRIDEAANNDIESILSAAYFSAKTYSIENNITDIYNFYLKINE